MSLKHKPLPDYGYRLNVNAPEIRPLYDRFKKSKGIPPWCPLSDAERHEFELTIILAIQKRKARNYNERTKEKSGRKMEEAAE